MVENVSSVVSQNQVSNNDNTVRNMAIATSVGVVGGGATGWMTKKIFKDNDFTDEFVRTVRTKMIIENTVDSKEMEACTADLLNLLESDNIDTKNVKKFIKKYAEVLKDSDEYERISKASDSDLVAVFKEATEGVIEDAKKAGLDKEGMKRKLSKIFDTNKKKFNIPELKNDNAVAKAIKSTITELKAKSAAKWAAGVAAVLGLGTYVVSKLAGSKEEA